MKKQILLVLGQVILATCAHGEKVGDFSLLDQNGRAHDLHYYSDTRALAILVHGNGCPIVRNQLTDYRLLRDIFEGQGVKFLMLNPNLQDSRDSIRKEAEEWGIDFPILVDESQLVGTALDLTRTGEVLLLDPIDWTIAYRGPVNDRVTFERQKSEATENYLSSAIEAVLAGTKPGVPKRQVEGCLINFEGWDADSEVISYAETIVPILEANCVRCHTMGGIGPWHMSSYEMVKGFSPMIREVIMTRRMPPWHADPLIGDWRNDRSLSREERQTLVRWIQAGSPRGDGLDALKARDSVPSPWELGTPDFIVELPEFKVPASGVVEYQEWTLLNAVAMTGWVRAAQVIPGDATVVHHVLYGTSTSDEGDQGVSLVDNFLGGYAPGMGAEVYAADLGVPVEAGENLVVQMHYTPVGKPVTDRTRIGVYLREDAPAKILRSGVILHPGIEIPPGTRNHEERAYFTFDFPATLYQFLPHAHYRGRSASYVLEFPDGTRETVLSVPDYDFNWQTGYWLQKPRAVPAGTRLIYTTVYDNSAQNPANPNPETFVRWGLQSWDEMLFGVFSFAWDGESSNGQVHELDRMLLRMSMGYMDSDLSGGLEPDEMPQGDRGETLREYLSIADFDANGSLGLEEWLSVYRKMTRRGRDRQQGARN